MVETRSNVDRALGLLSYLAHHPGGAGVRSLGTALEMSPSTVFRLLEALCRNGFARQDEATGKYFIGVQAIQLGLAGLAAFDLTAIAPAYLRTLVEETGESAFLARLDDTEVVYLLKVEGRHAVRTTAELGSRRPAHCTALGKTLLAALPAEQACAILRRTGLPALTRNTIIDPAKVQRELERVRQDGFAIDREEIEEGLMCLAAPVRDHTGQTVAAISMAGPMARVAPRLDTFSKHVRAIGEAVSAALGYDPERDRAGSTAPG